ncbi:MAG: HD domain-containing protein [Nitrospira sp.]|nr:HD domain-containing protein [Nitrospira sp.]
MPQRELRDPIHGFINREDVEEEIINSPVFQRLRKIRQLALASLVYPGAVHTRFDHSIGAMHVAGLISDAVRLEPEEKRLVRLAALLHDIGHGPFSHVSEPVLEKYFDREKVNIEGKVQIHEKLTEAIIREDEVLGHGLSPRDRERIIGILNGTYGDSVLKHIVSGPLDADKQAYLLRDSYFCGVKYGVFDLSRLSSTLAVQRDSDDRDLAINEDGVHALEQFVLAKYYMTTQVYRHKVRLITDSMIGRALDLGIREDGIEWLRKVYTYDGSRDYVREYKTWTDERLTNEILSPRTPDGYAKSIFQNLTQRQLHKRIATYRIQEFDDPIARKGLSELSSSDKIELEKRIGTYLSADHNLVIVNTFSIKSVREQARNSEASIIVMGPDVEKPAIFEAKSALFRSIDEAVQEKYIEVYAPIKYIDDKQKKKLKSQYHGEIRSILNDFMQPGPFEKEGAT